MIRITSGLAKNKRLRVPEIPGYRAVQEVAKLAVFSILGGKIIGSDCLDLFAGSGNLGIEALSRGAKTCDFVDNNHNAVDIIRENLKNCKFDDKAEVFFGQAAKYAARTTKEYDVVFVDPFYSDTSHIFLVKNLKKILNKGGLVAFFHGSGLEIEKLIKATDFIIVTQRKFGKSCLTIFGIK